MRKSLSDVTVTSNRQQADPSELLRRSAFKFVREHRRGDSHEVERATSLSELTLAPPSKEEASYILQKLRNFAENYAGCIPQIMRDRAHLFESPIIAPTAEQIITNPYIAVESIESIKPHLDYAYVNSDQLKTFMQEIQYVIETSSRGILGLGKDDSTEYKHILRALGSASTSAVGRMSEFADKVDQIPIPDLPKALPEKAEGIDENDRAGLKSMPIVGELASSAVGAMFSSIWKFVRARWAGMRAKAEKTWKAISRGWQGVRTFCGQAKDFCMPVLKFCGTSLKFCGTVAVFPFVAAYVVGAKTVSGGKQLASFSIQKGKEAYAAGTNTGWAILGMVMERWDRYWNAAPEVMMLGMLVGTTGILGLGIWQGSFAMGFHMNELAAFGIAAGVGGLAALVFGFDTVKKRFCQLLEGFDYVVVNPILTTGSSVAKQIRSTDLYYSLFAKGRKRSSSGSYDTVSQDVQDYFRKGQSKRQRRHSNFTCNIKSSDQEFWSKLSVLNVHVIDGKGGKLISLDKFFEKKAANPGLTEQVEELRKHFYRTSMFRAPALEEIEQDETEISMPVKPGNVGIICPLGYEICGVSFQGKLDEEGVPEQIVSGFPVEVEECALGSATINVPVEAKTITYRIRKGNFPIPADEIERFHRLMAGVDAYKGIEGEAFEEAVACFDLPAGKQMKLLFEHHLRRGFQVVNDKFLSTFINTSGDAVAESIGGLRLGGKDALTYYSASMYNSNGIPAVIVSGLMADPEEASFDINGYSQTAVLTEDGTLICDLSNEAKREEETSSNSLLFGEKFGLLKRMWGLSFKQVFNYAAEVGEILKSPQRQLNFFQQLMTAIFDYGSGIPFVRRKYSENIEKNENVRTDFDDIQLPPEQNVILAISQKLACEKTIEEARQNRSLNQVHYFYRDNPRLPPLSYYDRERIPDQHIDILDYSIRSSTVDYTAEVLASPEFNYSAKKAAVNWTLERLPLKEKVVEYVGSNQSLERVWAGYFFRNISDPLSIADYCKLVNENTIQYLSEDQAKSLLFSTLLLPIALDRSLGIISDNQIPDLNTTVAKRALLLASKLKDSNAIRFQAAEKETIAILAAHLGNKLHAEANDLRLTDYKRANSKEALDACANVIGIITDLDRDDQVSFFFDLLMDPEKRSSRYLARFAALVDRNDLFGFKSGEDYQASHEQSLGNKITAEFCRKSLADHNNIAWESMLKFFDSMGISAASTVNRPKILRHLSRELARNRKKGEIKIGFPNEEERPASYLAYKLLDGHSSEHMRLGLVFEKFGVLQKGQLEKVWPQIPEIESVKLIQSQVSVVKDTELGIGNFASTNSPNIIVSDVPMLSKEIIGTDTTSNALLGVSSSTNKEKHWAENALINLKAKFPRKWRGFMQQFDADCSARLLRDHLKKVYVANFVLRKEEVYRGALAISGLAAIPGNDAKLTKILSEASRLKPGESVDNIMRSAKGLFHEVESWGYPFAKLRDEAKLGAILTYALIRESKEDWDHQDLLRQPFEQTGVLAMFNSKRIPPNNTRRSTLKRFYDEGYSISPTLLHVVDTDMPLTSQSVQSSIWAHLYSPRKISTVYRHSLYELEKLSRENATFFANKFREPLSRFLYSRTGFVNVKSTTGDFVGYREYAEGDSLRQVDWKRSAKDGHLAVRLRDETEVRGLRLVYDLDFLAECHERWLSIDEDQRSRGKNPLKELFVLCNLAAKENIEVDFVLYGRGLIGWQPGIVKRSTSSQTGRFDGRHFANMLSGYIQAARAVKKCESSIFGANGIGPIEIFAADELPIASDKVHIFAVSDSHIRSARKQRDVLTARRILNSAVRDDEKIREQRRALEALDGSDSTEETLKNRTPKGEWDTRLHAAPDTPYVGIDEGRND